ncbi:MAG: Crp/Fnr family transcriptional regulator [Hyphomicrobiaceae bacterium]|nr:Crp/Fnr family transcriptional regulator [Hyphomicrobiaceae bacterium]
MHTVVRAEPPPAGIDAGHLALLENAEFSVDGVDVIRRVATGDILFQPGETRNHYRVEEGAIFHYVRWADGSHDLIEVAFPGDIIGLGNLSTHISTAQAMVESAVSIVTADEIEALLDTDDRLPLLLASAGEREFDYVRDTTLNSGKRTPLERVANYLIAVADIDQLNSAAVIADDISSGFVAERLHMSVDTLAAALVGLQHKGLVAPANGGLKITDVAELERLASAA